MNSYLIPPEPRFTPLRREAAHYLRRVRSSRLQLVVQAGQGDSKAYTLERRVDTLTVRGDGLRGAAHGFHHALRLLGFGYSFFADATPK